MPGVLNRMAGTAPPAVAPFMMPIRNPRTGRKAEVSYPKMLIRMGKATAMAMGPASPGIEPTMMPVTSPRNTISNGSGTPIPRTDTAPDP